MKEKKEIIKRSVIITILLFCLFLTGTIIWTTLCSQEETYQNNIQLCSEQFPQFQYEYNQEKHNLDPYRIEEVTEEYINCCWTAPHLNNEGIYVKKQCQGLKK